MRTTPLPSGGVVGAGVAAATLVAFLAWHTPLAGSLVGGTAALEPVTIIPVAWQPSTTAAVPLRTAIDADEPLEAVVQMKDGARYTGMLIAQDDDVVRLSVGGIEMRLNAGEVSRVDILPPLRERYERLRASIADDDIPALLNLVNWLVSRAQYELADTELTRVMAQEPRHPRALELQRLIKAQRALDALPTVDAPATDDPADPLPGDSRDRRSKDPMPVLSEAEINLIRVYELDLAHLPRIVIKRETVERLIEEFTGNPLIPSTIEGRDDLLRSARANPRRVLEIIFRLKARHLYPEIQVVDNPRAMQLFRERVHGTWLLNACASCHNTRPDAPAGPHLITRRPNSDATVYSNFLLLDRYRLPDGTPLINYDDPQASPLLQMGMPRALVEHPHPDVAAARGWSPVFLSNNTNSFQNATAWIRAMYRPRPEYPIDYPPDLGAAAPPEDAPRMPR